MIQKLFTERKTTLLLLAGLMFIALLVVFIWRMSSLVRTEPEVTPRLVYQFGYCRVSMDELCILSFGRDAEGNTVVNLFVPERDFPDFYLIAGRVTGEYLFECSRNIDVPTSVYCIGAALNLGERVTFSMYALEDDRLLASGGLILKAFLISTPGGDGPSLDETPSPTEMDTTPTLFVWGEEPVASSTPISTSTPAEGYPNPSYP
jgi:hypothetical protein